MTWPVNRPKVVKDATSSGTFFSTVSAENSDRFSDVDVMVTYAPDAKAALDTLRGNPLWSAMPVVKNGAIAVLQDDTPLAAVGNPSPLNVPWGLDRYLGVLDEAAAKAR